MKKYKRLFVSIYELIMITLGLLTFNGERFIDRNINGIPFVVMAALYGGVLTYKIAAHIQESLINAKNGTWGK